MTADDFLYDVAFSFLGQDETFAFELNERLKDRVTTFIYSDLERQKQLGGRDGDEAFSLVFGKHARTVVVLYREGWGKHGFTSAEATAIRNRASEFGFDFTTFIPMETPPMVPPWLPRERIWVDVERWGIDPAAAVIESRVREAGGEPRELTVAEMAARVVEEVRETCERDAFLNSIEGVQAAQREVETLFAEVQRVCTESSGLLVKPERHIGREVIISFDAASISRRMTLVFQLTVNNSLTGSELRVVHSDWRGSETRNVDTVFQFGFGPSGEHGWRKDSEFYTSARLVDTAAKKLIQATRDKLTHHRGRRNWFLTW